MSKQRRIILPISIVFVLASFGFWLWSRGAATNTTGQKSKDVKGLTTEDALTKQVTYDQLQLQVPARFVAKPKNVAMGKPVYVQQLFTVPVKDLQSIFGDQAAITIGSLPAQGLGDVSDAKLRLGDKAYTILQISADAILYEKSDTGYETGVFLAHEAAYVSVVLSGPLANQAKLKSELNTISSSVIWR